MPDLNDLIREAQQKEWGSLEEFNAVVQQRLRQYNDQPQAALGGLSPKQAHVLLSGDWEQVGPLRLDDQLPPEALQRARFLKNARTFLAALAEAGTTKATSAGNLNRRFVGEMLDRMDLDPEVVDTIRRYNKVTNEMDVFQLHVVRIVLDLAGLIKRRKGKFSLTQKGNGMRDDEHAGALYALLFRTYYRKFNLAYLDNIPVNQALQETIAITFFILRRAAAEWRRRMELAELAMHPNALDGTDDRFPRWEFVTRVIYPLESFGLLEIRRDDQKNRWQADAHVRKTPLYDRFIQFQFE